MAVVVAVGAPAVDGKATEAVRRALADALGLRPRDVVLRIGATSRDKVFTITGDQAEIGARLAGLRDSGDQAEIGARLAGLRDSGGGADAARAGSA